MIRVIYNNRIFKMLNNYNVSLSNNEVTFNEIQLDFTGHTMLELPYKFNEVKIVDGISEEAILNGEYEIIFTGYVDDFSFNTIITTDDDRILNITLLSPLKLSTNRFVNIVGQYELSECIRKALAPLISDGYVLKQLEIGNHNITASYVLQSVESIMNDISKKYNLFWHINEKKEIFVNEISNLFTKPVKMSINGSQELEMYYINPKISSIDYANIINIKNIRLFYSEYDDEIEGMGDYPVINLPKETVSGDIVELNNPIDISENTLRLIMKESEYATKYYYAINLILENGVNYKTYSIYINYNNPSESNYNKYVISPNITFSDDSGEEGEIVLQRDSFFNNLITGIKVNIEGWHITHIETDTALRYTQMRFMDSKEIEKMKGIISDSGQVEATIDFKEQWATLNQLTEYGRSAITENANEINEIEMKTTKDLGLNVGDLVNYEMPDFMCEGVYVITKVNKIYVNDDDQDYQYIAKKTDMLSSFIDLFRPAETQSEESKIENILLNENVEETILEKHTVEDIEVI